MYDETQTIELLRYFKKLQTILNMEPKFSFVQKKLYDKQRIDDIFCCIEASWPKEYKKYTSKVRKIKIKTPDFYRALILAIKNKIFFSSKHYLVNFEESINALQNLQKNFEYDMKIIIDNLEDVE